jgi:N-acetylated-alpha-linked acidic dipeptidase
MAPCMALIVLALALSITTHHVAAAKSRASDPYHVRKVEEFDPFEKQFLAVPSNETAKQHLFRITRMDHVAGTPEGLEVASYVREELAKALQAPHAGVIVETDEVDVLLAYPVNRSVVMSAGGKTYTAPLSEPKLPSDATSGSRWRNLTFNAYSPSGSVSGDLVYANYGSPDDFDALDAMGVSVKGRIVIVRYGSTFRGLKVMLAERRGALGVIIYSDPMEDGYSVGQVYPEGPWRPPESVQRGSVQFNSLCAGDPARLYSNESTDELCGFSMNDLIPKIPVLPMSYSDAEPLLRELKTPPGVAPPHDFQGGLPIEYQTGPGPAIVSLDIHNDIRPGKIHNVFATIPGADYGTPKDRVVILGNHRDAWVFGAVTYASSCPLAASCLSMLRLVWILLHVYEAQAPSSHPNKFQADPNSGTVALLEVARAFGQLLQTGWRPRRTLVLCSWVSILVFRANVLVCS